MKRLLKKLRPLYLFIICFIIIVFVVCCISNHRRYFFEATTAIATLGIVFVAYWELEISNKTSKAEFIRKFSEGFFTDNTRDLIMLCDNNALNFQVGYYPYFAINQEEIKKFGISEQKREALINRQIYSTYEIDDWLLGHFEDIAGFEEKGLIYIKGVYNHFDWYINMVWKNSEIQKYITYTRKEEPDGESIYENFEALVQKLDSYKKRLGRKK